MKKLALFALPFLLAPVGVHAQAAQICPKAGYPDGCAGNSGTIQYPDMLTNAALGPGTGQNFKFRPPHNIAGVDYPVGVRSGIRLKDPAISQPPGCRYAPTGSVAGGPKLTCSKENLSVIGYDFGPIGGHECTALKVANSNSGKLIITDNNFKNCPIADQASGKFDYQINFENSGNYDLEFSHNTLKGECVSEMNCPLHNYGVALLTRGAINEEYNAFIGMPQRPQTANNAGYPTVGDLKMRYNLFFGFAFIAGNHGEIMEQILSAGPTVVTQKHTTYAYNTVVQPNTAKASYSTALIYVSGGAASRAGSPIYEDVAIDSNTLISNKNGDKPVAYNLVSFTSGDYTKVSITNNYFSNPGGSVFQCYASHSNLRGEIDGSGLLTVRRWSGYKLSAGQKLWFGGHNSGIVVGAQRSGTPGQDGEYETSGGSGPVRGTDMVAYYKPGDTMIKALSMSGNVDMETGKQLNTFDNKYRCNLPLPD